MRLLTIFLFLLLTHHLFGQLQTDIQHVLATKDLRSVQSYKDNVLKKTKHVGAFWSIQREIVLGFEERILTVNKYVPNEKDTAVSTIYTFKINLITTDSIILFYDFMERSAKKIADEWVEYYLIIDTYSNDSLLHKLDTLFLASFGGHLNRSELFIDSVVYGSQCTRGNMDPVEKTRLDYFVKTDSKDSLVAWLQSGNTETQLYAVQGYYQLVQHGHTLTSNELFFIANALQRRGKIRVCSGCLFSQKEIQEVAKDFNFDRRTHNTCLLP